MRFVPADADFNPLPPHGGRHQDHARSFRKDYFNPLPPHGGRPRPRNDLWWTKPFQSTPSAWRETDNIVVEDNYTTISIHSLRMEGDTVLDVTVFMPLAFQSTPSAWRETRHCPRNSTSNRNFNPLPPHGGRLYKSGNVCGAWLFQSTPSAWRETIFHWIHVRST